MCSRKSGSMMNSPVTNLSLIICIALSVRQGLQFTKKKHLGDHTYEVHSLLEIIQGFIFQCVPFLFEESGGEFVGKVHKYYHHFSAPPMTLMCLGKMVFQPCIYMKYMYLQPLLEKMHKNPHINVYIFSLFHSVQCGTIDSDLSIFYSFLCIIFIWTLFL